MACRVSLSLCWIAVALVGGCREPAGAPKAPATQPETSHIEAREPARPRPTTVPIETRRKAPATTPVEGRKKVPSTTPTTISTPGRVVIFITDPNEPQTGWLRIEEKEKADKPASVTGTVVKPRKLVVTTKNVKRIRIELPKAGMPSNRRVLLRIDNQGIEITGRRGPVGYFQRSTHGDWQAVRKRK